MPKEFKDFKREYMEARPSKEFKERMERMIKRKSIGKKFIGAGTSVAAACLLFVTSLNAIPVFAQSVAGIPGMDSVVKVLTFGRYQFEENNFSAKITTPEIEGLLDKELEEKINRDFREQASLVKTAFEEDYRQMKAVDPEAHLGVRYDYEILTDNEDYLAIDVYWYHAVGSSSTVKQFYTIDKKTGHLLELKELFKEEADYKTPISQYIVQEMKRQNKAGINQFWTEENEFAEPFRTIKEAQQFYLNRDGDLVICFDKYEVGPGSSGSPEFVIPDEIIKDIKKR